MNIIVLVRVLFDMQLSLFLAIHYTKLVRGTFEHLLGSSAQASATSISLSLQNGNIMEVTRPFRSRIYREGRSIHLLASANADVNSSDSGGGQG